MIRLLSFIVALMTWGSVQLVTVDYTKDIYTPIAELNNHSLYEVFENRNMAMPDLMGKEYLGDFNYSIYNKDISEIKYNVKSGEFHSKTKDVGSGGSGLVQNFRVEFGTYTLSINSDNKDQSFYIATLDENGNYGYLIYANHYGGGEHIEYVLENITGVSLYSYETNSTETKFTIQLEKGSEATPYQVSTIGPYSEIDISTLGLTVEEMDVYYQQYIDNKDNPLHERYEVTVNDLGIADLVILMSFGLGYVIVFLVIRKVVKKK